ncbi:DUF7661 family protein [Aliagarivorans marinus]|uniref:DUF7661 family protein n=1 Tax=Aliagarivorans marinus TaxID=561965 RepID=UPI003CCBB2D5
MPDEAWVLYNESDGGLRTKVRDVVISASITEDKLAQYLDDINHDFTNKRNQSVFQIE